MHKDDLLGKTLPLEGEARAQFKGLDGSDDFMVYETDDEASPFFGVVITISRFNGKGFTNLKVEAAPDSSGYTNAAWVAAACNLIAFAMRFFEQTMKASKPVIIGGNVLRVTGKKKVIEAKIVKCLSVFHTLEVERARIEAKRLTDKNERVLSGFVAGPPKLVLVK